MTALQVGHSSHSSVMILTHSLQVLEDEGMYDNAVRMGEVFKSEMTNLPDIVTDMRGKGLFWGVVIKSEGSEELMMHTS